MPGRRPLVIVAGIFFVAAAVALIVWLGAHSDTTLARWSSIATVFSAVITVLALVAAIVPLWRSDGSSRADARQNLPEPGIAVFKKIRGKYVNVAGGNQVNINLHDRDNEQ